jgi:hypothetical protein
VIVHITGTRRWPRELLRSSVISRLTRMFGGCKQGSRRASTQVPTSSSEGAFVGDRRVRRDVKEAERAATLHADQGIERALEAAGGVGVALSAAAVAAGLDAGMD